MPHVLTGQCWPIAAGKQPHSLGRHPKSCLSAAASCYNSSRSSIPSRLRSEYGLLHRQQNWTCTSHPTGQRRKLCLARGILDTYRRDQEGATMEAGADEPPCTVDCVKDIYCVADLDRELEQAGGETLVVVDFYKTACGSCRYIQPGFLKLCRASADEHAPVKFLRHNIFDEYEELSDLSEKLKIRAVPLFYFFKGGQILEKFATRERRRIAAAINHHAGYEVLHPG